MVADLHMDYGYRTKPSTLLNSLFMSTVNTASRALVSMASDIKAERYERWRPGDHLRFMGMLMTWLAVWVLRVLMDSFPSLMSSSSPYLLLGGRPSAGPFFSSSLGPPSSMAVTTSSGFPLDLIIQDDDDDDVPSVKALGRALAHILALLNDIPATSRKYQFAMAMADNIMEGNFRDGHVELMQVNRLALSSAFGRTLSLLCSSLQHPQALEDSSMWVSRIVRALPFGYFISPYMKGLNYCINTVLRMVGSGNAWQSDKRRRPRGAICETEEDVVAEKLAQELVWITYKLGAYGAVDEAMVQWSYASGLASLALTTNPRIQGAIVKISALLMGDLPGENIQVPSQVKFRLLAIWLPLLCHASNGLVYPVLTSFEKLQVERAIDKVLSYLPSVDQEVILTNWLQDFAMSTSDWPNLQPSYDRWCQYSRGLAT